MRTPLTTNVTIEWFYSFMNWWKWVLMLPFWENFSHKCHILFPHGLMLFLRISLFRKKLFTCFTCFTFERFYSLMESEFKETRWNCSWRNQTFQPFFEKTLVTNVTFYSLKDWCCVFVLAFLEKNFSHVSHVSHSKDFIPSWNQNLKKHVETVHEGIKPFKCSACAVKFAKTYNS